MWNGFNRLALITAFCCFLMVGHRLMAQADARVCYCFGQAVSDDFMLSSRALYGTVGIVLSRDMEIRPSQYELVRFTVPSLPVRKGCSASYTFYVGDLTGRKLYEASGRTGQFSYRFPSCGTAYEVILIARAKSETGADGNCTRRLRFRVTPTCNQSVCDCFMQKNTKSSSGGDLALSGKVQCLPASQGRRNYVIRFSTVNKTNCVLNLQTLTVHGQTIEVPPTNTAPNGSANGMSLGFSTPMDQSPPADSKLGMLVRYSLNGRKCAMSMEIPYQPCN